MKTSIAIDSYKQVILAWKISRTSIHDVKHARPLLKKSHRIKRAYFYVLIGAMRRSIAETIISVVKRGLGEELKARNIEIK